MLRCSESRSFTGYRVSFGNLYGVSAMEHVAFDSESVAGMEIHLI